MASPTPPGVHSRPLLVRDGARFTCFSDGLCCSDIHALGPMSRAEVRDMRRHVKDAVMFHEALEAHCMATGPDGFCAQREDGLCGIHKRFGPQAKPVGCRRFPYGLVATPEGGRITTEHRCPCRTLGERPALNVVDAARSVSDGAGRLDPDHRTPERMPISAGRFLSFARYREHERALLSRILGGPERPEEVLSAQPLPALTGGSWQVLAAEFYNFRDDTSGGVAMVWFADALLHLIEGLTPPERPRPWAPSFERAIARTRERMDPEEILRDWVADEVWMMRWLDWDCTFDVARAELTTRIQVARYLMERFCARGVRADQAAAEAVMISELAACNEDWAKVVDQIANDPSPAARFA